MSEDEAYQWLWSKRLALSYFSKPPLIAYLQFIGTSLWGDTEFGVRFFVPSSPRWFRGWSCASMARQGQRPRGVLAGDDVTSCVLVSAGSLLMTIDPPSVLGWAGAMVAGRKAVQPNSRMRRDRVWVGAGIAFGFLAKFVKTRCNWCRFVLVLVAIPSARPQWKRPGPYVALFISALALLPVIIWNAQHHGHGRAPARSGRMNEVWRPTFRFFLDHTGALFGLLNPVLLRPPLGGLAGGATSSERCLPHVPVVHGRRCSSVLGSTPPGRGRRPYPLRPPSCRFCLLVAYATPGYRAALTAAPPLAVVGLWSDCR